MAKVYVVVEYDHESTDILAVFSTEKDAKALEAVMDAAFMDPGVTIEEYVVDAIDTATVTAMQAKLKGGYRLFYADCCYDSPGRYPRRIWGRVWPLQDLTADDHFEVFGGVDGIFPGGVSGHVWAKTATEARDKCRAYHEAHKEA